ncbi:DUF397 domain-containing protein [Pseudonocardiaceae bacterium YIM PH 21723]|nr:DUF397 domain-containing protein [Pseudonocardiaceae bacterium YIM PH 21723]
MRTVWRKSSKSGGEQAACVEKADGQPLYRDSKNPEGPSVGVSPQGCAIFQAAAAAGQFDRPF